MTTGTTEQTFLFADLAGYTALTEAHGDEQAADAAEAFCEAVRDLLPAYRAAEVKAIGDAMLVRVADPTAAARLATRILTDYGKRHQGLGVRIGIHTGTAVRRGEDWFGSAVNVASRVADLAVAGQVLLTDPTRRALSPSVVVRELGERRLRNVPRPVVLYELVISSAAPDGLLTVDPVCRMVLDQAHAVGTRLYRDAAYSFCSDECAEAFAAEPERYVMA